MGVLLELCTVDDVLRYPGLQSVKDDDKDWIERLVRGFSQRAETFTNRSFYKESRTSLYSPGTSQRTLQLAAFGTSGTITTVHESYERVFDADSLTDPTAYVFDVDTGMLSRDYGTWLIGRNVVQVVYDAGLGTTIDDVPEDLRMAAIMQSAFWYQRRNELGLTQRTLSGGAISFASPSKLLPEVEEILFTYKLYAWGSGGRVVSVH